VGKYWGRHKSFLECCKGFPAFLGKVPRNILAGQTSEQNYNIRVVEDKMMIEMCKSEEGLHIFDFPWFQPISDGLDLLG
jgi:hypothetical protein